MLKELVSLGFKDKEARIYAALVELGECTIGPIEKKLGIHKQILYGELRKMQAQGIISATERNGRTYFAITDPDILRQRNESQKAVLESLVPKIYSEMGSRTHSSHIKIYEGITAVQSFLARGLKESAKEATVDILGAAGNEFLKVTRQGYFFDRYEDIRLTKKIRHRLLMYESQRGVTDPAFTERRYVEVRYLPEYYLQPVTILIWPSHVSITLYSENPQAIHIKNAKITEGFRNYFAMLWNIAKP